MKQQAKTLWIKAINIQLITTLVTFVILYSLMFNVVVTFHLLRLTAIPLLVSYLIMRILVILSHSILAFKNYIFLKSIFTQFFLLTIWVFIAVFIFIVQQVFLKNQFETSSFVALSLSMLYVCYIFGGLQTLCIAIYIGSKLKKSVWKAFFRGAVRKVLFVWALSETFVFVWAFAAHTQLSLTFLHNIPQKRLIIRVINFAKSRSTTSN